MIVIRSHWSRVRWYIVSVEYADAHNFNPVRETQAFWKFDTLGM